MKFLTGEGRSPARRLAWFLASLAIAALTPFLHSATLVVLGVLLVVYQGALLWWSRRAADEP